MNARIYQPIRFTNTSDIKGEPIVWFEWDFGDGNTDTNAWNTVHSYSSAGTYIAKITVQTTCGQCTPYTETINIYDEGEITCELDGCNLLLTYDTDKDGIISDDEMLVATADYNNGIISEAEYNFMQDGYDAGSIEDMCPGCVHDDGVDPFAILAAAALVGAYVITQR